MYGYELRVLALARLMAQQPWIVSIPGTRSLKHLEDNLGAAGIGFAEEEKAEINAALSRIAVSGARYPAELEKRTGK